MAKIQINENDIRQMVCESVKRVLREQFTQDINSQEINLQEINPQEVIEIVKRALEAGDFENTDYKFTKCESRYYEGIMEIQFYEEYLNGYKAVVITTPFGIDYTPETYDGYSEEINGGIDGVNKVQFYYYNNGDWSEWVEVPNINKEIEAILNVPKFEKFCKKEFEEILHLKFYYDAENYDYQ